ncbi:hypothetical protein Y032_0392g589 [Ancylostoma ceylanicum]|uniref:Uncharacterized protein n=1 Tax=Ancylostoma ceylanicum TaxID=53326 RepID=A0A016RRV9_9BILA|nr:hypothetical protein Y032_0392g589 [Ancylostoma ceylanicum]
MLEIRTYPGPFHHDNPSKVHQQAQKQQKPRFRRVEVAKIWSREVDRSKLCCHDCNVGKRVLACTIDKINGFTRQFGSANYHRLRPGKRV